MNERINGLWWKARIGYNNQSCDPEVLEKFAELIVQECADVTHRLIVEDGKEFPVKSVAYRLKEHFEVE